jgi:hypothetical protein
LWLFRFFTVLEQETRGPFDLQNLANIKEQRALYLAIESVRTAKGVLLADAGDRERLAGEAGK